MLMKNADDDVVLMAGKINETTGVLGRRPNWETKIPTALCKFAIISLQAKR